MVVEKVWAKLLQNFGFRVGKGKVGVSLMKFAELDEWIDVWIWPVIPGEELAKLPPENVLHAKSKGEELKRYSGRVQYIAGEHEYSFGPGLWVYRGPHNPEKVKIPEWMGITPKDLGEYQLPRNPNEKLIGALSWDWAIALKAFGAFGGAYWAWVPGFEYYIALGNPGKIRRKLLAEVGWGIPPGGIIPRLIYDSEGRVTWWWSQLLNSRRENERFYMRVRLSNSTFKVQASISFVQKTKDGVLPLARVNVECENYYTNHTKIQKR